MPVLARSRRCSPSGCSRRDRAGEAVRLGAASIRTGTISPIRSGAGVGVDALQIGAAADELARRCRPGFSNSTGSTWPTQARVEGALLLLQQRLQCGEPLGLDRLRHLVRGARRRRARARRIFEREGLGEADLAHEIERRAEIRLALAGKADDEIRRQREVGARRAQPFDGAAIIVGGVARGSSPPARGRSRSAPAGAGTASAAARRDAPRSARRRHRADARSCSAAASSPGIPASARISSPSRHSPPSGAGAVIGVDVLAEQRDLARAVGDEPPRLGDDCAGRPRIFGAARIGHDAEGAELVAAFLHGQKGGDAAGAAAPRGRWSNFGSAGKLGIEHPRRRRRARPRASISGRR